MTGGPGPGEERIEIARNRGHDLLAGLDLRYERGEIDEAEWHRAVAAVIVPAYLGAGNPRAGSGHSGDAERWERARRLVTDAIDRDGAFLDVGRRRYY